MRAILAASMLAVCLGGNLTTLRAEPGAVEVPVAMVNGDAITVDDVRDAMQRGHTSDVAVALEDCLRTRIVLQLARRRELVAFTDERELHAAHQAENLRRQKAQEKGEPIFGPRQLTWPAFRIWWLDGIERALQRKMVEATPPSARQLETFYAAHPDRFTPAGATAPPPYATIEAQVRRAWEESCYRDAVATARRMARVEVNGVVLRRLFPAMPPAEIPPSAPTP